MTRTRPVLVNVHTRTVRELHQQYDGVVTLRVTNDGATPPAVPPVPSGRAGTGLVNLSTRCEAAGGSLTADTCDDTFTVLAEIPTDTMAPTGW